MDYQKSKNMKEKFIQLLLFVFLIFVLLQEGKCRGFYSGYEKGYIDGANDIYVSVSDTIIKILNTQSKIVDKSVLTIEKKQKRNKTLYYIKKIIQ
jgi:transcription termination factor Rho